MKNPVSITRIILIICLSLFSNTASAQLNFVVNSTSDAGDSDTTDGNCDTGSEISPGVTVCTLRAAIEQVNAAPDPTSNLISFDIPTSDSGYGSGVWRLQIMSSFPALTANHLQIDASTQPGSACGDMATLENHELKISLLNFGFGSLFTSSGGSQSIIGFDLWNTNSAFTISGTGTRKISCNETLGGFPLRILDFTEGVDFSNNRVQGGDGVTIGETTLNSGIFIYGNLLGDNLGVTMTNSRGISIGLDAQGNEFGNEFRSNIFGALRLSGSSNNEIVGNKFQVEQYLISLNNSNDNLISKNQFDAISFLFGSPVQVRSSDRNTFSENTFARFFSGDAYLLVTDGSDLNVIGVLDKGNIFEDLNSSVTLVQIGSSSADENIGNQIRYNVFANNLSQGIDLFPIGRNINDAGDADGGPNKGQNYPVLSSADALRDATGTDLSISYDVDSAPANSTYPITVHFYLADSDNEDAEVYIGQDSYTVADYNSFAPGTKVANFRTTELLVSSNYISATATDAEGNTSEISDPIPLDSFLPVELSHFDARIESDRLYLNWTTLSEENNAGFEIELKSKGTPNWEFVGFIDGAGTTHVEQNYNFEQEIIPGHYLVRLKQLDFDGTVSYSNGIAIESEIPIAGYISESYPNPSRGVSYFNYTSGGLETSAKVFDVQGVLVQEVFSQFDENGVTNRHQIDLSNLASGIYFLRIVNDAGAVTKKINLLR